jgi:hypothetical protein
MLSNIDKPKATILSIKEMEYEKYLFRKPTGESFFVIQNIEEERSVTRLSVKLCELIKKEFDNFTYASVKSINKEKAMADPYSNDGIRLRIDPVAEDEYLILTDSNENKLYLSGCTVGYAGTGPHGTHEVLNKLGFRVPMRFIIAMKQFSLAHPDNDPEFYKVLRKLDEKFI